MVESEATSAVTVTKLPCKRLWMMGALASKITLWLTEANGALHTLTNVTVAVHFVGGGSLDPGLLVIMSVLLHWHT